MNFKEVFEKFQRNEASPEEAEYVIKEIETVDLIIHYLDERAEAMFKSLPAIESQREIRAVKKRLRRRSVVLVATAVAIVICAALLFEWVGKPLLNKGYYNPLKVAYSETEGNVTTDYHEFDVCMDAFTELHFPGKHLTAMANIENVDIGKYSITIFRQDNFTGDLEYLSASINKNVFTAPLDFWAYPYDSSFVYGTYGFVNIEEAKEVFEYSKAYLKELPDYLKIKAYVSFNRDISMDELIDLAGKSGIYFEWAGIRNAPLDHESPNATINVQRLPLIGFEPNKGGFYYGWNNDKYPNFMLTEDSPTADQYESHFKSMLRFQLDHSDFLNTFANYFQGYQKYYQSVLDYVNENGVKSYGVLVYGSPKDILDLAKVNYVCDIKIDDIDFYK